MKKIKMKESQKKLILKKKIVNKNENDLSEIANKDNDAK